VRRATTRIRFVLQSAFVVLDPNHVEVSVRNRFQLIAYFSGKPVDPAYDAAQLGVVVEEFLYVLSSRSFLSASNLRASAFPPRSAARSRRTCSASRPAPHASRPSSIVERMVVDACFERVLRSIAAFHTPNGAAGTAVCELRDSVLYEVNPCLLPLHTQQGLGGRGVIHARLCKRDGLPKPQLFVSRQYRTIALAPKHRGNWDDCCERERPWGRRNYSTRCHNECSRGRS
jgi:E3 ubiquitin-protein ligase UBR1